MGRKYHVDEGFFDVWSHEMSYVLGFLFADGSLEDASYIRGKYIRVTSTDRNRIEAIRRLLRSRHTIVEVNKGGNYKKSYLLRIGNAKIYNRLLELGVTPRKSLTMSFPNVPDLYLSAFVRGYFDGDGCVHIGRSPKGTSRLLTIFTSGSRSFLESLKAKLAKVLNTNGGSLHAHGSTKGTYQLRYFANDSMKLFEYMYPSILPPDLLMRRKYAIFVRYFDEIRGNPSRRLSKYISGHVVKG